jgi:putative membrane protein
MRNMWIAATALLIFAMPANGQTTTQGSGGLTVQEFTARAAMGGVFEIESARIVQSKSKSESTEAFARHLVEDHGKSSREMRALSRDVGASPPAEEKLDARRQEMTDSLQQVEGRDADRLFARQQVNAHEEALALYQSYASTGDNAALQATFAQKTIPALGKHLAMAKKLTGDK